MRAIQGRERYLRIWHTGVDFTLDARAGAAHSRLSVTLGATVAIESRPQALASLDRSRHRINFTEGIFAGVEDSLLRSA